MVSSLTKQRDDPVQHALCSRGNVARSPENRVRLEITAAVCFRARWIRKLRLPILRLLCGERQ